MSDSNDKTLQAYEHHVEEYIEQTPQEISGELKTWIDTALGMLPDGARILELGSAFGRDAVYFQSKGFVVDATDAAQSFVDYLNKNDIPARRLNIITDEISEQYDMVFANAVLLHLTPAEFDEAMLKMARALKDQGIIAFSVKKGDGEKWEDRKLGELRYFKFWQMDELVEAVEKSGLKVIWKSDQFSSRNAEWLHIIAQG